MAIGAESGNQAGMVCDCGHEVDIIAAVGDRYSRHTICHQVYMSCLSFSMFNPGYLSGCDHLHVIAQCRCYTKLCHVSHNVSTLQRKCHHFQWIDNHVTRAEEISLRTLEAANRALKAEVLSTKGALRRYVELESVWKADLHAANRSKVMWMSICVTIFAAYIALLCSTMT